MTVSALIGKIDQGRNSHNLSSAIRVYVLDDFRGRTVQKQFIDDRSHSVISEKRAAAVTRV
jgi:predicted DNA-binding ribbon-helix-helix protein